MSASWAGHQQGSVQPYRSASIGWHRPATPPNGSTSQPGSRVEEQPATDCISCTSPALPSSAACSSSAAFLLSGFRCELDLAALRRAVAVVAQDVVLWRGSLLDNLRYAAPLASEAEALDAARRAEVDSFARELPEGYASDVGTAGAALSVGQRQRIAIARALLQDPCVLVLDEATSAVDEATEARIVGAIDELFAGRTRIVISHRKATLAGVERLIALEDGRLVERSKVPAP